LSHLGFNFQILNDFSHVWDLTPFTLGSPLVKIIPGIHHFRYTSCDISLTLIAHICILRSRSW
jgi:hypothetical protein